MTHRRTCVCSDCQPGQLTVECPDDDGTRQGVWVTTARQRRTVWPIVLAILAALATGVAYLAAPIEHKPAYVAID